MQAWTMDFKLKNLVLFDHYLENKNTIFYVLWHAFQVGFIYLLFIYLAYLTLVQGLAPLC